MIHVLHHLGSPTAQAPALCDTREVQTPAGPLLLHATRVAYSPEHRVLFVADVHLGKAASFRKLGVPVPVGTTEDNLRRLSAAIERFKPEALYILGDFIHSELSHSDALLHALQAWRSRHAQLPMFLIRGNHDREAGVPEQALNLTVVDEPYPLGRFALCHHPQTVQGQFVLAGHTHPVVHLQGKARSRVRLPAFHLQADRMVFPAFGAFTGGCVVKLEAGEKAVGLLDSA